jgi:streptomycin 6-kinase
MRELFQPYLRLWDLEPEGEPFATDFSWLCPVRRGAEPALLKVLKPASDEGRGADLLAWYDGKGAVRLLRAAERALLMERAHGRQSLSAMALAGSDRQAAEILSATMLSLLAPRSAPPPQGLESLEQRFAPLLRATDAALQRAAASARALLAAPLDRVVLHGDLHHENVIDGGARGWLAIDPKGMLGERSYEAANILCNPAAAGAFVRRPERFRWQARHFGDSLAVPPERVLAFALAHAGLAICWSLEDGTDPAHWRACTALLEGLQER